MTITKSYSRTLIFPRHTWHTESPVSDVRSKTYVTLTRSRTGSPNPRWKQLIKLGQAASTLLSASESTLEWATPSAHTTYMVWEPNEKRWYGPYGYGFDGFGGVLTVPSVVTSHLDIASWSSADAAAIKSLYKKLREVHTQVAGGVILGELKESLHMIARPASALREAVTKYVTSARSRTKRIAKIPQNRVKLNKVVADTYLEHVFGWIPLLSDVRDGAVALARMRIDKVRTRFKAWGVDEKLSSVNNSTGLDVCSTKWNSFSKVFNRKTVVYYGAYSASAIDYMSKPSVQKVIDLSGFNPREFLPTVYELIPYSFLADYFINIGEILEAGATDTSSVAWITKVTVNETVCNTRYTYDRLRSDWGNQKPMPMISQTGSSGGFEAKLRTIARTPLAEPPFPELRLSVPDIMSRHMANIVALAQGGSFSPRSFLTQRRL